MTSADEFVPDGANNFFQPRCDGTTHTVGERLKISHEDLMKEMEELYANDDTAAIPSSTVNMETSGEVHPLVVDCADTNHAMEPFANTLQAQANAYSPPPSAAVEEPREEANWRLWLPKTWASFTAIASAANLSGKMGP